MRTGLFRDRRVILLSCVSTLLLAGAFAAWPQATRPSTTSPAATQPTTKPATVPAVADKLVYAQFTTNKSSFLLELNHEKAPISVDNFMKYVDSKFYNDTVFHRLTKGGIFVIQGGGIAKDGSRKTPNAPIKNEWNNGLKNQRGTISMARTPAPDSATSQFFINVQDDPDLDVPNGGAAYAVFGKVVAGMDVVDAIHATSVGPNPDNPREISRPVEPLVVEKAERVSAEKAKEIMAPKPATQPATTKPASPGH